MNAWKAAATAAVVLVIAALLPGNAPGAWLSRGSNLNVLPGAASETPAMALTASATFVTWSEQGRIQVKTRPHGAPGWTRLGGTPLNRRPMAAADNPDITAIGSTPYVIWSEELPTGADAIFVKYWDGAAWVSLGGSLNVDPAALAVYPSIASNGTTVYAAWDEYDSARGWYNIYVKYWDSGSGSWVQLGGNLDMDPVNGDGTLPDIQFDNAGTPYVAWNELDWGAFTSRVYVKQWNGAAWVSLGGSLNVDPAGIAFFPDLAIAQGINRIYAAWGEDGQIYVKYWDTASSSWLPAGGAVGAGWAPSIATYAWNPVPHVAYTEDVAPGQAYVKRWNGTTWALLGAGSLNFDPAYAAEEGPALRLLEVGPVIYTFCAWSENNALGGCSIGVKQWR